MFKWKITCLAFIVCIAARVQAQDDSYTSHVQQYISQYKSLAMSEQKRSGIPAAITLGQGILETQAGTSVLVLGANNHFGIKCKKDWTGETFAHTDDAPNECFRKYPTAAASYRDHSDYLKSSARYSGLFKLSETDYAGWAVGLKKCGYATNPRYAQQLIKIIEDFKLQDYTYAAMDNEDDYQHDGTASSKAGTRTKPIMDDDDPVLVRAKLQTPSSPAAAAAIAATPPPPVAQPIASNKQAEYTPPKQEPPKPNEQAEAQQVQATNRTLDNAKPVPVNGLKAVYAFKGELPFQYALKFNVRYEHLLEMNDLPDAPLAANMFIYLEKKNQKGQHPYHIVKPGETMAEISQLEGVQLRRMMAMNHIENNEEPVAGTQLYLQDNAPRKPEVTVMTGAAQNGRFLASMGNTPAANNSYIDKNTIQKGNPALDDGHTATTQPLLTRKVTIPSNPATEAKAVSNTAAATPVVNTTAATTAAQVTSTATPVATNKTKDKTVADAEPPAPKAKPASERPVPPPAVKPATQPIVSGTPSMVQPAFHPTATNAPVTTEPKPATEHVAATTNTDERKAAPAEVTEDNKTQEPVAATTASVTEPKKDDVTNTQPVATANTTEATEPVIEKPAETAHVPVAENTNSTAANPPQDSEPMDDLDRLKARLDRVVYVNDKKVAAVNQTNNTANSGVATASVDKKKYYTVREGDTAFSIAKDNNITMKQLMDWNDLNFDQIKVGQKLRVKE